MILTSSAHGANAQQVATLTPASGRIAWIMGCAFCSGGATSGGVITCTITGLTGGGTLNFSLTIPTGVAVVNNQLVLNLGIGGGLEASAKDTAIVCTIPAAGSGNIDQSVAAWGYSL